MMRLSYLLLMMLVANVLFGQHTYSTGSTAKSLLNYNGAFYNYNLKGLSQFMDDLKSTEREIYKSLEDEHQVLLKRQKDARIYLIAGTTLGTVIALSGMARSANVSNNGVSSISYGSLIGGSLLIMIGGIMYAVVSPSKADFLKFINRHNRENKRYHLFFTGHYRSEISTGPWICVNINF